MWCVPKWTRADVWWTHCNLFDAPSFFPISFRRLFICLSSIRVAHHKLFVFFLLLLLQHHQLLLVLLCNFINLNKNRAISAYQIEWARLRDKFIWFMIIWLAVCTSTHNTMAITSFRNEAKRARWWEETTPDTRHTTTVDMLVKAMRICRLVFFFWQFNIWQFSARSMHNLSTWTWRDKSKYSFFSSAFVLIVGTQTFTCESIIIKSEIH